MEQLIGCGVFIVLMLTVYWLGRWILGPIDRAAKARRAPARISIGDFLCLFVAVQLPLAFANRMRSEETEFYFWLFVYLSWIVAPVIWISCALSLSRAGITSSKHRFIFMGLVLPVAYYGLTPFVVSGAYAIVTIAVGNGLQLARQGWMVLAWIGTGVALVACGWYTNSLFRSQANVDSPTSTELLCDDTESVSSATG